MNAANLGRSKLLNWLFKPAGLLALWQFPVEGWVPGSISRSQWFSHVTRQDGVHTFRRC